VFEDHTFEQGLDELLLFGRELGDGFKLKLKITIRTRSSAPKINTSALTCRATASLRESFTPERLELGMASQETPFLVGFFTISASRMLADQLRGHPRVVAGPDLRHCDSRMLADQLRGHPRVVAGPDPRHCDSRMLADQLRGHPIVDFLSFVIPPRDSQVFAFLISCRGFLLPVSGGTAQL